MIDLIADHTREELERQLTELKEEQEALAEDYDVSSLEEFREQLATDDLSAEEPRERRNVIVTWEAINTDLGFVKHALQLYDDVVEQRLGELRAAVRAVEWKDGRPTGLNPTFSIIS